MNKRKEKCSENYLEKIPVRQKHIIWSVDENGIVTLDIENTGFMNRMAQKLFRKPGVSHIHLDQMGSFVWPLLDGEKNLVELGKAVEEKFGKEAYPLYERLAKFFQILESYQFVSWK